MVVMVLRVDIKVVVMMLELLKLGGAAVELGPDEEG